MDSSDIALIPLPSDNKAPPPRHGGKYPMPAQRSDDDYGRSPFRVPARRAAGSSRLFVGAPRDASSGLMRIHFINVGQGDAALFEFPCGAIVVDSGGEKLRELNSTDLLSEYLESFFEERTDLDRTIDLVVLTHPHIDHTRGASLLSGEFTIARVADNGQSRRASGSSQQNALREFAQDTDGVEYLPIRNADIELIFPDDVDDGMVPPALEPLMPIEECEASDLRPEVTFLWGGDDNEEGEFKSANNHSVVFRVDFGDVSALFTGDLEHAGIEGLIDKFHNSSDLLDVDIFQVGHHGSHNATTEDLVGLITPDLAVFSAGNPEQEEGTFTAFRFAHPNHKAVRVLDDPWTGVLCNRAPVDVPVGIKGAFRDRPPVWELWTLESALFSTGWDGNILVEAAPDGDVAISTDAQEDETGLHCP